MLAFLLRYKKTAAFAVPVLFLVFASNTSLSTEKKKAARLYHTEQQRRMLRMLGPIEPGQYFLTSSACKGCHGKDVLHGTANVDPLGNDVNLYDDWQATMMALSAKDPLWRAKVSHEVYANPGHGPALENKCTSCHAPMGHYTAYFQGTSPYTMAHLQNDTIGLDGVSCVSCHIQGSNAGSQFSGIIQYDTTRHMYGPFSDPMIGPMQLYTGFTPALGNHMSTSMVCASCHTLITDVTDLNGNYTGDKFIEQATFHEWKNSIFSATDKNCQSCHMPAIRGPVIIANDILNLPGRTPFNLHKFMGSNVFMLQLMKNNKAALGITATDDNFDSTIASTIHMLQNSTLELDLGFDGWLSDTLASFSLKLSNKAGHKFPSGYPSRRAFVQFVATTQEGDTLFKSGMLDPQYELIGHDAVTEPHHQVISQEDQVQIYEMVMNDVAGNRTTMLERAHTKIKDNRLPPNGFLSSAAVYDTVTIEGIGSDTDFNNEGGNEGSGTDRVNYRIRVPGGNQLTGSIHVYAKVYFQAVPPRWVSEMFNVNTPEINLFKSMFQAADKSPVLVAATQMLFVLTPNTSLDEAFKNPALLVSPNPSVDGLLKITAQSDVSIYSVQVYNSSGVCTDNLRNPGSSQWEYLLRGAPGQYVLRIETSKGTFVKKVIKL